MIFSNYKVDKEPMLNQQAVTFTKGLIDFTAIKGISPEKKQMSVVL